MQSDHTVRRMIRICAVLCLLTVQTAVTANNSDISVNRRIIGGRDAEADQFPWQVVFAKRGYEGTFCGGSIIGDRLVLTAAHCFIGTAEHPPPGVLKTGTLIATQVISGQIDISNGKGNRTGISASLQVSGPSAFNPYTLANDVFILRTQKKLAGDKIRLPDPDKDYTGQIGYVSGFGKTALNSTTSTSKLQFTSVLILSGSDCESFFGKQFNRKTMLCVDNQINLSNACRGDSGGPLIVYGNDGKPRLIGISSFGSKQCSQDGAPSVYTRVSAMIPFIREPSAKFGEAVKTDSCECKRLFDIEDCLC